MLKEKIRKSWYNLCRIPCIILCHLLLALEIRGLYNVPGNGSFVLLSNHQSFLDPVLCGVKLRRPLCYVARDSLFKMGVFRLLIRSLNAVPIRRGQADLSAVRTIVRRLKDGWSVCIFPEATRTRTGRIADIKPGVALLSRRSGAPVVPVVIDGAFETWPRNRKIFSVGQVTVYFGRPVSADQIRAMGEDEFARFITETLRNMQSDCRKAQGKQPYDYSKMPREAAGVESVTGQAEGNFG